MMWKRVAYLEGKTMNVLSPTEYDQVRSHTLQFEKDNNQCIERNGVLYPIRTQTEYETAVTRKVGAYPLDNGFTVYIKPEGQKDKDAYDAEKKVIDFNNTQNYGEIITKMDQLKNEENTKLLIKDNVFEPYIDLNDSPALRIMKNALAAKKIDPESYRQRLGPDFSNTMRLLTSKKNHTITLKKMISISKAYDLNIDVTVSDKPGAVNPMGHPITVRVTDDDVPTEPIIEIEEKEKPILEEDLVDDDFVIEEE